MANDGTRSTRAQDLKQQDLLLYSADEVPEEDVAKLEERVKGHVQSAPMQRPNVCRGDLALT